MKKEQGNKRKRYILLGIMAILAVGLCLYKCAEEQPEPSPDQPQKRPAVATPEQTDTLNQAEPVTPVPTVSRWRSGFRGKVREVKSDSIIPAPAASQPPSERQDTLPQPQQAEVPPATPKRETPSSPQPIRFPHRHLFRLGVQAGVGYSKITGLGSLVESYTARPTFVMEEKGGIVPKISVFGTWKYRRMGAELGVSYTRYASQVTERKPLQGISETTKFRYDFITPQLMLRFYAHPKFYAGAGVSTAIPLGDRHIEFATNSGRLGGRQHAERTQEHLQATFKPRVLLVPTLKLGYADPKSGLEAGVEYGLGINDLIHTRANDYGYQERTNHVQHLNFTIGYSLPLNRDSSKTERP